MRDYEGYDPIFWIRNPWVFAHVLAVGALITKVAVSGIGHQEAPKTITPELRCDENNIVINNALPMPSTICSDGAVKKLELGKFLAR